MNPLTLYLNHREAIKLSAQLQRLLQPRGLRVATAESITAGQVASIIAMTPGASGYLEGGSVVYNLDRKVQLGVCREIAQQFNCVSTATVLGMAETTAKYHGNADIGIATTGYAEPYEPEGIILPFAWVGLWFQQKHTTLKVNGSPDWSRTRMQQEVAVAAVKFLVTYLHGFLR